jgi:hypothetical protein
VSFKQAEFWEIIIGNWIIKKVGTTQAPVAHTCSPSYSGDRDQEDHSLKPVQGNSLRDPILKKPFT